MNSDTDYKCELLRILDVQVGARYRLNENVFGMEGDIVVVDVSDGQVRFEWSDGTPSLWMLLTFLELCTACDQRIRRYARKRG